MIWNKKEEEETSLPSLPFSRAPINNSSQIIENSDEEEHFESIKSSEKQSLPEFPDSPVNKGFSQSAIKDAVSDDDSEKIPLPPKDDTIDVFTPKRQPQNNQNTFIQPNPFLNSAVEIEKKPEPPVISKLKSENKSVNLLSVPHDYPQDAPHPPGANIPAQRPQFVKPKIEQPPKIDEYKAEYKAPSQEKSEEKTTDVFVKIDKFYSAKKALSSIKQNVKEIESILGKIRETKLREEREIVAWEKNVLSLKEEINKVNENLFEKII